jgi:Glycosyl hydrolase family 3 C-terminal domain
VFWDFDDWNTALAGNMAYGEAVALVFTNSDSGEGYITVNGNEGDRYVPHTFSSDNDCSFPVSKNLTAWHNGDDLILAVAAQNNNTIVVVNSVGPLIIEPWIEHPNITAVIWAGIQGQEAGNAIADVLYGAYNPSGRLPYTIAKDVVDYPAQLVTKGSGSDIVTIDYTEGYVYSTKAALH